MAFNRKIRLITRTSGYGNNVSTITADNTVWGNVEDIGVTTKYTAEAAGKSAEISVTMWRSDYLGYTHAIIDGTEYMIGSTGRAKNDLHIKLVLSRG